MSDDIVGYTVKEILIRLDSKLDVIDAKLETKADRTRVHELAATVAGVDKRVTVIESQKLDDRLRKVEDAESEQSGARGFRRFLWPSVAAVIGSSWWVPNFLSHHKL